MNKVVSNILLNGMKHEVSVVKEMLEKKNISSHDINSYLDEIKAIYGILFYNQLIELTTSTYMAVM